MGLLVHILLFLLSASIIWFFAGLLIESVNNVARRFNQSGFTVAFFVLGFLTSISEISVMVNSTINGTPQVSAGNLVGASFVIILLVIPVVAIVGKDIQLRRTIKRRNLALALITILLPPLLMLDGSVSLREGLICIMFFATLLYLIRSDSRDKVPKIIKEVEQELIDSRKSTAVDIVKIIVGAVFIFVAGHLLVEEAVFLANFLSVPVSIIGLLVLSVGTNIPELVIAVRSILKKRKDIAFGDYLGSSVANVFVFGLLPVLNGRFSVEPTEFIATAALMLVGFTMFYFFAKSQNKISRKEGLVLVSIYVMFVVIQTINLIRFATD
ncbi:sodium:calcium antiporter [bacterium]|nr:MAG: sodium:calcium antiporter [bacterium]